MSRSAGRRFQGAGRYEQPRFEHTCLAFVVDWILGLIPSRDHFKNNDEYELASAVFANVYNQLRALGHESAARMLLEAMRGCAAYSLPPLTEAEEGPPNA
jgi:hypothetical protein